MNAINPYQPSGSSSGKLPYETKAKIGLGSFLVWQFLAFVPTESVLCTVVLFVKCWEDAASQLWDMPFTNFLIAVAVIGIVAWLPLALYTFFSSRVQSGGAALSGIAGGAFFAFGMLISPLVHAVVPLQVSDWLDDEIPFYLWFVPCVVFSLVAVTVLGHIRSKPIADESILDHSIET